MKYLIHYAAILIVILFASSCSSAYKLLEDGSYDKAINYSVNKLKGKKNKKEKYVIILEDAFAKATEADLRHAEALQNAGKEDHWEELHSLYSQIDRRQEKIRPLLPLTAKSGYRAKFNFVKIEPLLLESRSNAARTLHTQAHELIAEARNGNREKARLAYDKLLDLNQLYEEYMDMEDLMQEAIILGKNHVHLQIENNSPSLINRDFEQALLQISLDGLNTQWVQYHLNKPDQTPDYEVIVNLQEIDVSPEQFKEERFTESREIEDGYEYVLDQNGNVAKDSLGNDIREPRIIEISAEVIETCQIKESIIQGSLDFYDRKTGELLKSENISSNAVFEHFSSNYRGDERALTDRGREYLSNRVVSFPTDEQLLYDAAQAMKPEIKRYLRRHQEFFL